MFRKEDDNALNGDITVLVAEDDRMMADALVRGLNARGYNVKRTERVMDGLDLIEEADVLILDIRLLNGDGRSLLYRWVRDRHLPVLVISGVLGPDDEEELLTAGAWNVLPKPFRMDTFFFLTERYSCMIKDLRRSARVGKLEKQVRVLLYAVVLLGGTEILPRVVSWLGIDVPSLLSLL